jgi:hypothetical protein
MANPLSRSPTRPEPGYYLTSLVGKGWAVPCRLDLKDGLYSVEVDGEAIPGAWDSEQLGMLLENWVTAKDTAPIVRVILWGQPCEEHVYAHRLAMKEWASQFSPDHPCLTPMKRMNPRLLPATEF